MITHAQTHENKSFSHHHNNTTESTWSFTPHTGLKEDLTLSFDVIYHLVEDNVFHDYMAALFAASTK